MAWPAKVTETVGSRGGEQIDAGGLLDEVECDGLCQPTVHDRPAKYCLLVTWRRNLPVSIAASRTRDKSSAFSRICQSANRHSRRWVLIYQYATNCDSITPMEENISGDIVFEECQIGKGLKPLAQHGSITIGTDKTITLRGTKGDIIDNAALSDTTAKQMLITGGQTVSLHLGDRKYNVTPGWGSTTRLAMGASSGLKAPRALVKLVKENGPS